MHTWLLALALAGLSVLGLLLTLPLPAGACSVGCLGTEVELVLVDVSLVQAAGSEEPDAPLWGTTATLAGPDPLYPDTFNLVTADGDLVSLEWIP